MRYLLFLYCFLATCIESKAQNPAFDSATAKLYFNAPLQTLDTSLFDFFRQHPSLKVHPPSRRLHEGVLRYSYGFTTHPAVSFPSVGGLLEVYINTDKKQNQVDGLVISFDFKSAEQALKAYQNICQLFASFTAVKKKYYQRSKSREAVFSNGNNKTARQVQVLLIKNPTSANWVVSADLIVPEGHKAAN
ncbi:MAG TPA: hypothetical protein VD794_09110 [Flavisolibacter sp.]|nr:hypothetical protein [Flavisolibacter sp.]